MGQLSANTTRDFEVLGEINSVPVATSTTIYKGSAVGYTGGYARQLVAADIFAGFAEEYVVNSGANGAKNLVVRNKGVAKLAVGSVAVTDIGKPVYASDGDTFTLTASTNTRIGTVVRFVESGVAMVAFDASDANAMSGVTAITDSTTGTAGDTLAAGVGVYDLTIPVDLTVLATSAADIATGIVLGHKFKILSWEFITNKTGTGTSASQVFNLEIGTTDVGTVASTCTVLLADTNTLGKRTAATAVAGANTGAADATLSIEAAASGTAFTAGTGFFVIKVQNMDTADAVASLAAKLNQLA